MFFFPALFVFILAFLGILVLLFLLIQIGVISYAFEKIGISSGYIFLLLLLSIFGSSINIPLIRFPGEPIVVDEIISYFGLRFRVPVLKSRGEMILAVNVGGAIIPFMISLYLLIKVDHLFRAFLATLIVALMTYKLARPIRGMGIAVPLFIPPLFAAAISLLLAPNYAPAVAYISGTLGTLIGADLLNLGKIRGLGAPIASIGGAGTFDGIFLTGIVAVLLA
ncbi:MAG: DUF1614 domain-containing protein [Candidatus Tectomicrobia bacterium]|nr:DUF1614 domain-containing protein [Candidatus Tectomicrobia bacterium]